MKKIYTTIVFTLLCFTAFAQNGIFGWETAVFNGTTIDETVNDVDASFTANGIGTLILTNGGGIAGTTGNVVVVSGGNVAVPSVTVTFSTAIDISFVYALNNSPGATSDVVWTFTPVGGNNDVVTQEMPDNGPNTIAGTPVLIDWQGVTSFTITSSDGDDHFGLDDIIFSPATAVTCETFDSIDTPGEIDPGATITADCENDPNFYDVPLTFLGEVGTDIFVDEVMVDIQHTFAEDLTLFLQDNEGNRIVLAQNLGGSTNNAYIGTIFKDGGADISTASPPFGAGPYAAQGGSINEAFAGTFIDDDVLWSLIVCDGADGETGTVNNFSITFCDQAPLSVADNELSQEITVFPNPASDIVQLSEAVDGYEIYNVQGQKVLEGTTQKFDVSTLTSGMYFVNITKDGKLGVKKLMVK